MRVRVWRHTIGFVQARNPLSQIGISVWLFVLVISSVPAQAQKDLPVAAWRSQIRSNFFIPDPLPALIAETHRKFTPAPGVRAEAVSYATQFGTRVPAILYLPDPPPEGGKKIPALTVVNGHGGDKSSWYAWYSGILYARAGAAVLTYDPIGEGERNAERKSGSRAHDMIKGDEKISRWLAGLMMTDVMQAVSYLAQREEVDSRRIAVMGYSLGSFVVGMTGAVESRLRACVLVGGGNFDGPNEYWDNSKQMCQGLPYRSLNFLGDRPAALYALHAERGSTLIFNGMADTVVGMPANASSFFSNLQAHVAQLRGREVNFEFGLVDGVSHRPFFVTRPVALWLERQLDFPNWTEASIRELPETRIGDWSAREGVALDKLYATEEREAGTRALGNDVPGFAKDGLNVFSQTEWEKRKSELILESWLTRARTEKN